MNKHKRSEMVQAQKENRSKNRKVEIHAKRRDRERNRRGERVSEKAILGQAPWVGDENTQCNKCEEKLSKEKFLSQLR